MLSVNVFQTVHPGPSEQSASCSVSCLCLPVRFKYNTIVFMEIIIYLKELELNYTNMF